MTWTQARSDELSILWKTDNTCRQIAVIMGQGITKNAVIGRARRMHLTPRKSGGSRPRTPSLVPSLAAITRNPKRDGGLQSGLNRKAKRAGTHHPPKPRPTPINFSEPGQDIPASRNIALEALRRRDCRWPYGDPRQPDFAFCGHRNWNGLPYCEYHARIAYTLDALARRTRRAAPYVARGGR